MRATHVMILGDKRWILMLAALAPLTTPTPAILFLKSYFGYNIVVVTLKKKLANIMRQWPLEIYVKAMCMWQPENVWGSRDKSVQDLTYS